jgi:ATP-dependent DNA helicase RecG
VNKRDRSSWGENGGEKLGRNEGKILQIISQNKHATITEIASSLKIATTTVENNLEKLKNRGLIRRICPDKEGY